MTTPADWYPDPELPGGLRYWDGTVWTEHRAPAPEPSSPQSADVPANDQTTSAVSLPDQSSGGAATQAQDPPANVEPESVPGGGAHRAPDTGAETPSWDSSAYQPASSPSWDAPPGAQSYSGAGFAPPPGPPPGYGPPPTGPSSSGPNKKLLIGLLSGAAALILILAVVLVYVFVIRDDDKTVTASPSSSSSSSSSKTTSARSSTSESETTTETEAPRRESAGPVTDGSLSFTITDIEAAESVTSTFSDAVGKTAQGTYAVVHLTVGNTGPDPVTFLATFQRLNGSGQSLAPDDEATIFAGGGYADVAPGAEVETVVVFDVPDDVEPESMFLQESPITPGVELPF